MRLPVEDDWRPRLHDKIEEDDYDRHVRTLAERLCEANKAAGQQSKRSHKTAKWYYDRQTKLEQFKKGDFVYLHDPTHKRGKAKKFSYQYKGPFEAEQRISSLIYKIQLTDGTFTLVHANRLKRAYGQETGNRILPADQTTGQVMKLGRTKKTVCKECTSPTETHESSSTIPSQRQIVDDIDESYDDTDEEEIDRAVREYSDDSDWTPGSLYLQRKLQSDKTADDVTYRLRSRLVGRSRQELEADNATAETSDPSGSKNAQNCTLRDVGSTVSHSYNLRDRTGTTLTKSTTG